MACIPPASVLAALAVACAAATAHAKDVAVVDVDRGFAQNGLQPKVEVVVHRGERLLLLRIDPTGVRSDVRRDGGTDAASPNAPRVPWLPVRVECARATLRGDGRTARPHAASPCLDEARLGHPKALPIFVAFKYPAPGTVELVVPVVVHERDPPIETRLRRVDAPAPKSPAELLGPRDLVARVRVD